MRVIAENRSLEVYWKDLTFLEATLLADEETQHLARPVTETLDSLHGVQERDRDTMRHVIQARARATVADVKLDESIRKVHSNALHHAEQDRKRNVFAMLFPQNLVRTIRHALKNQLEIAKTMQQTLTLDIYDSAFRDTQTQLLAPRMSQGEDVLTERSSAEHERTQGRLAVQDWKDEVNAVRTSIYGELLGLAAQTHRKKAWADTFFPKANPRKRDDDAGEE